MNNWLKLLVAAGIVGYGLATWADEPAKKGTAERVETKLAIGQKAPEFKIKDSAGKVIVERGPIACCGGVDRL